MNNHDAGSDKMADEMAQGTGSDKMAQGAGSDKMSLANSALRSGSLTSSWTSCDKQLNKRLSEEVESGNEEQLFPSHLNPATNDQDGLQQCNSTKEAKTTSNNPSLVFSAGKRSGTIPVDQISTHFAKSFDTINQDEVKPPNGGWGWIVCFSAFLINVVLIGAHNCFGVLYFDLVKEFDEPRFKTAWVGSIAFGCILVFAPLSGYLSNKYDCRKVSVVGIVISAASLFLSSFASSSNVLYVTYGFGFGFGTSFAYTQGAVMISKYFSSRHALASGVMLSGSSIGTLIMSSIYTALKKENYSWQTILKVFSGCVLFTGLGAATYSPLQKSGVVERQAKTKQATKFVIELSLWKNKAFVIWLVAVGLAKIGYLVPWVHLVTLSAELGFDRKFGSNLLEWMGIVATVSRLIVGRMADLRCINRLYISQISAFLMGAVNILQPNFLTRGGLIYYVIALGALDGGIEILLPVMTLDLVGSEQLAVAWGCILGAVSLSCIGPPVAGAIHDSSGSYLDGGMFYFAGAPMIAAALILFLIPCWAKKQPQVPALSYLSVDPSHLGGPSSRSNINIGSVLEWDQRKFDQNC